MPLWVCRGACLLDVQGSPLVRAMQVQLRAPSVPGASGGKWSMLRICAQTAVLDLPSMATARLRFHWFGTRNNTGHRTWW